MAFSLMNGLSATGAGLAAVGMESQRTDAAKELQQSAGVIQGGLQEQRFALEAKQAALADQWAAAREHTARGESGDIAAAAAAKKQTFEAGESQKARENEIALEKLRLSKDPDDVRLARAARDDPSLLDALVKVQQAKTGMSSVYISPPDQGAGPRQQPPPTQGSAPSSMAPSDSAASAPPGGSKAAAVSGSPDVPTAPTAPLLAKQTAVTGVNDVLNDPKEDKDASPREAIIGILTKPDPTWNLEVLNNVRPEYRPRILAMLEGREAPPPAGRVNATNTNMLNVAHLIDPKFDESTWLERFKTRQSVASGPIYQNTLALNTAMEHVAQLGVEFAKMGNYQFPFMNPTKNLISEEVLGKAAVPDARRAIDTAATEIRRALVGGGGGSLTELQEWQKNFPINGSEVQQINAVQKAAGILMARMGEMTDQVNTNLGKGISPTEFLSPNAKKALTAIQKAAPAEKTLGSVAGDVAGIVGMATPGGIGSAIAKGLYEGVSNRMGGTSRSSTPESAKPPTVLRYDANGNRIEAN